ncbi:twin-arginine translocase TatA/TatE family subunit [Pseudonocardia sp.]|uniref:twin-arginine translocase TatA/TatE family subunit n=1 Tax=Pseudonocardia sp. TaxID=60912 RepID=UPI0031FDBA15
MLLVVVALFVLGPERLPAAAQWVGRSVRQVKSFATGAQERLNAELGPELAELRKPLADLPLAELRRLRNPRAAVVEFLFADHIPATPPGDAASSPSAPPAPPSSAGSRAGVGLAPGERPPTDPDAT